MTLRPLFVSLLTCLAIAAPAAAATNAIYTVAGTDTPGYSGDGGSATAAQLRTPYGVAPTPDGGYLIADSGNHVVRRVSPSGVITTVAGNGTPGYSGDGHAAKDAELNSPTGLAPLADGGFLVSDQGNDTVRRVLPNGNIETVAGTGNSYGFSGDGGPATSAQLAAPYSVVALAGGGFLISDTENQRIRRVSAAGVITTIAGNGTPAFAGDGGPALSASFNYPYGIALAAGGSVLVADRDNERIRRFTPGGKVSTVVGNGTPAHTGDGGPAVAATVDGPNGITIAPDGGFVFADTSNRRVRRVSPSGRITTIAGDGSDPVSGEGGPATLAGIGRPGGVAITADGGVLLTNIDDSRVRFVDTDLRPPGSGPRGLPGPRGPAGTTTVVTRLVAALRDSRLSVRRGHRVRVRYIATRRASATLDLLRGKKRVRRVKGRAHRGRNSLSLRPRKRGHYRLRLTLRTRDHQVVVERARLTVRR